MVSKLYSFSSCKCNHWLRLVENGLHNSSFWLLLLFCLRHSDQSQTSQASFACRIWTRWCLNRIPGGIPNIQCYHTPVTVEMILGSQRSRQQCHLTDVLSRKLIFIFLPMFLNRMRIKYWGNWFHHRAWKFCDRKINPIIPPAALNCQDDIPYGVYQKYIFWKKIGLVETSLILRYILYPTGPKLRISEFAFLSYRNTKSWISAKP